VSSNAAPPDIAEQLNRFKNALQKPDGFSVACDQQLATLIATHADRTDEAWLALPRRVRIDRERAEFGAWYEAFPRSWGSAGKHATLADFAKHLGYIKSMGFDVIYLPPIHPIGNTFRKGKNNTVTAAPEDVGSPWGIGSADGGHADIHPELGTLADFENLRRTAAVHQMELALDLALQCSPDHPWVTEHPEWFHHRADGTIRYAENPPKKYQDIYPLNFETTAWRELWRAIREIIEIWITRGVRIFRVDNPHTKPFDFWEWLLADVQQAHPDILFLAEAFTRPKTMYRLAKIGFSQSYTYFTWRTEKKELADYLNEITTPPVSDFFRPNFFTNTPDILHKTLQHGGQPMFLVRLGLAALSTGNWGIYGPAMELQEATPREPGSEEYLDSEKYELKQWNLEATHTLAPFIARLNHIRNSEAALRINTPAVSETIDEKSLLAWSRFDPSSGNHVLVVVNLEPDKTRTGRITLRASHSGIKAPTSYSITNLLTGKERVTSVDSFSVTCTQADPVVALRLTPIFDVTEDDAHA
jgi:starch synthase (maltosyl-transferring)